MEYPNTPFKSDFNTEILTKTHCDDACQEVDSNSDELEGLLKWLCSTPNITSLRVNTLTNDVEDVLNLIKAYLNDNNIKVEIHPILKEVIIIHNIPIERLDLNKEKQEVIIDVHCGASVLRGAHIFAPGVIGMQKGAQLNDKVSVYVDVNKKCKKGFCDIFNLGRKVFVGNGVVKMTRKELFCDNNSLKGIAIEMLATISGCPTLNINNLPTGSCILQNLPSIICVYLLAPKPNEVILDMCAAPGHKTTHIAALMENKGILVALDKIQPKINKLERIRDEFKANFKAFRADSTKILLKIENNMHSSNNVLNGPPFLMESFDRILLDAPCSALGKRPQFLNDSTEKIIRSFVPLQRKLFENAVALLKPHGTLVYSTCTITLGENEGVVAWALKKFKNLKLIEPPSELKLGSKGWKGTDLSDKHLSYVQRFDHLSVDVDSVGFFVACFNKS
ncbi:tRNA (cytosine(72)-C(5))-methyltransferase NSUN6 [Onthophagus taurus]|uniref:tRNA (cytosine(72)-C(5))-methyltransferase NSUN6 n=1 Tax=Onthophagus taurus TaxID=166361 RepID=UPI0039BDF410